MSPKQLSAKTPANFTHRKSRSMPLVEFQIRSEVTQNISRQFSGDANDIAKSCSPSFENVIPALGRLVLL